MEHCTPTPHATGHWHLFGTTKAPQLRGMSSVLEVAEPPLLGQFWSAAILLDLSGKLFCCVKGRVNCFGVLEHLLVERAG